MNTKTLVLNLFGGPGSGKSTAAAGIFSELKWRSVECELATEFAKDLVWEKRQFTFSNQIYLFAKQHHRIFRLLGQVDVVITDSPILLSPIYDVDRKKTLEDLVVSEFNLCNNYNVFLRRAKNYNPKGRNQTESQAIEKDEEILRLLDKHRVPFEVISGTKEGMDLVVNKIVNQILPSLR